LLLVFCVVKSSKCMLECFYFHSVGCRVALCCAGRRCFVAMFEVSTVLMLILFFWDVTLCSGADGSWHIKEFFILLFRPTNTHTIGRPRPNSKGRRAIGRIHTQYINNTVCIVKCCNTFQCMYIILMQSVLIYTTVTISVQLQDQ